MTTTARTYTEAQYSTPDAQALILRYLDGDRDPAGIDRVARYLSQTLRVGGMRACRALVVGAIHAAPDSCGACGGDGLGARPHAAPWDAHDPTEGRGPCLRCNGAGLRGQS